MPPSKAPARCADVRIPGKVDKPPSSADGRGRAPRALCVVCAVSAIGAASAWLGGGEMRDSSLALACVSVLMAAFAAAWRRNDAARERLRALEWERDCDRRWELMLGLPAARGLIEQFLLEARSNGVDADKVKARMSVKGGRVLGAEMSRAECIGATVAQYPEAVRLLRAWADAHEERGEQFREWASQTREEAVRAAVSLEADPVFDDVGGATNYVRAQLGRFSVYPSTRAVIEWQQEVGDGQCRTYSERVGYETALKCYEKFERQRKDGQERVTPPVPITVTPAPPLGGRRRTRARAMPHETGRQETVTPTVMMPVSAERVGEGYSPKHLKG